MTTATIDTRLSIIHGLLIFAFVLPSGCIDGINNVAGGYGQLSTQKVVALLEECTASSESNSEDIAVFIFTPYTSNVLVMETLQLYSNRNIVSSDISASDGVNLIVFADNESSSILGWSDLPRSAFVISANDGPLINKTVNRIKYFEIVR
jgi:hypothetical protein